jgi:tRNA threonylcarbamoyladenosine biosynthesis protein TsaE
MATPEILELQAETGAPAQTAALARALAPFLPAGSALCLEGDLGAGKTTFVAALVAALGGGSSVVSPTFTLENRYPVEAPAPGCAPQVVHVDLYRFGDRADPELLAMMLEAREEGALLCVEWGQAVLPWLSPCLRLSIKLLTAQPGRDAPRHLTLRAVGRPWPRQDELAAAWGRAGGERP